MRILIGTVLIALTIAFVYTEMSYRASTTRVAELEAEWGRLELPQVNGCFEDPFADAIAAYVPRRIDAGYDVVVARGRSLTLAVAAFVSMIGCLLIRGFTLVFNFGFVKSTELSS